MQERTGDGCAPGAAGAEVTAASRELPSAMDRRDFLLGFPAAGAAGAAGHTQLAQTPDAEALISRGIRLVPNMANLRVLKPKGDEVVWLRGYRHTGDGGEGVFDWDAQSTEPDNGGTIIALAAGGKGRWRRQYSGPINVLWFDSAAKAMDYANLVYNVVLYFPRNPDVYVCGDKIVKSGVTICGDGVDSKISGRLIFETGPLTINGAIRDVVLKDGAYLRGCRNRLFENVQFGVGVTFDSKAFSHYNTFLNCVWIGVPYAIDISDINHFNKVISCRITLGQGFTVGIRIAKADGWNIVGTSIETEPGVVEPFGPFLDIDGRNHTISGCWLERGFSRGRNEPGVILRGDGINFQIGSLADFTPLVDLGKDNIISGALWHASQKRAYLSINSGIARITPNDLGEATFPHGLLKVPKTAVVCMKGRTKNSVDLIDVDVTSIKVRIKSPVGDDVTIGSHEISWYCQV